ncbi:MAG: prepilin-type N-terminal cleavage/methylation domain-containing protein [Planctomycetes bacterium]|nr:prepilin-type N-terminal cleavage/methylation domain-containing protein [Planctomycetota bacterium]
MKKARKNIKQFQHAFTLVELMLALAVMAVVGVTATAILSATTYGTSDDQLRRGLMVKTEVIKQRINGSVRSALEVVLPASGSPNSTDYFIVWANDTNTDSTKDNNEMLLVERNTSTNELSAYRNPSATGTFSDAATFRTAALAAYPSTRWATNCSALSCTGTFGTGQTTLLTYSFTLTNGGTSASAKGAASLRQ